MYIYEKYILNKLNNYCNYFNKFNADCNNTNESITP